MQKGASGLLHRHLFGIEGASREEMKDVLDPADGYIELNRQAERNGSLLCLHTSIIHFFESSMRTRTSFEIAGKPGKGGEEAASR
jgi:aspartate carbamoyltransferase catalytic subunit